MILGLTAYGFFVVSARALGPERYGALSVLWTLVFFAAPGFFFPLEQEIGRAVSARRTRGQGGGPVIKRAAVLGSALAVALMAVSAGAAGEIVDRLFDGEILLLVGLLIALPAYAATHLVRGGLAGSGRFASYGTLIAGEGILRLVVAVGLWVAGVTATGAYGLLIGLAPLAVLVLLLPRERQLLQPGPPAPWAELSGALGWLLLGAVFAQAFVNASVPVVKVLADEGDAALAGQFQAGLIIARVPLFLFQAVQAALLPKLASLAAAGRTADFRTGLRRLLIVVAAIAVMATAGAFAVGPPVLQLLFGEQFDLLDRMDLGLLAAASGVYMVAVALAQALIALHGHAKAALGWGAATFTFTTVIALGDDLLLRVEMGLLVGAVVAILLMAAMLRQQMRLGAPSTIAPLVEAISPEHEIIEP